MTAADTQSQETDFAELDEDLITELESSAIGKAQLRYLQPGLPQQQPKADQPQGQPTTVCDVASRRVRSLW